MLPPLNSATQLESGARRVFIGAYGFEDRSLGWARFQGQRSQVLSAALVFRYRRPKGKNKVGPLQDLLGRLGASKPTDIPFHALSPGNFERTIEDALGPLLLDADEVVLDISALTKLLILVLLCKLDSFSGNLRIVYSEAESYSPTREEYERSKKDMGIIAHFPSQGVESIIRTKCLSSIRMQGQPVTLVAFASFNEQLVRSMLGTIAPHRLLLVNGHPPRPDFSWRERATQEIHLRLIGDYQTDNSIDESGFLRRVTSTLDYRETVGCLNQIYVEIGAYERLICAATGSKMQTVGLFFAKAAHPDIHIEYPTPDSYFARGMSEKVRKVYELEVSDFSGFLRGLRASRARERGGDT
jgi:hypothetical protein